MTVTPLALGGLLRLPGIWVLHDPRQGYIALSPRALTTLLRSRRVSDATVILLNDIYLDSEHLSGGSAPFQECSAGSSTSFMHRA
jgi:hypothetical protein